MGDRDAADRGLTRWRRAAELATDPDLRAFMIEAIGDDALRPMLDTIFGGSPYLTESLLAEPALLRSHATLGVDTTVAQILARTRALAIDDRSRLMRALREQKRRISLAVALGDLGGEWPLERVTETLTRFADLAVRRALAHLLREAHDRQELALPFPDEPERGSGIVVLGMGKLGAFELNYSSDIDLIVLWDEGAVPYLAGEGRMPLTVKIARSLVYMLDQRTKDGYVFRTDLRLRPHPPGHPLALSTEAAEIYYERHGQNWERAALIKARVIAGDVVAGERFLGWIAPFIWRKHLDYAAIADIHSIKRQINAFRGFGTLKVEGHDIKVGRGGIREIEFFAQTQQLILGGRHPELRCRPTCEVLQRLAQMRWLEPETAADLIDAYRQLRRIEHRLQMVADRQTHLVPDREPDLGRFARFLGHDDSESFVASLRAVLETVERHYAALFETSPDLGMDGPLVFTGKEDDPATLETLAGLGFKDPSKVARTVRRWHHGHIRAMRSTRARELLTELTPTLLRALQRQADTDRAFALFDEFLSSLPAGVQIFSLFRANPGLLTLMTDLMGAAPRLARQLSQDVALFDAMLAPDFLDPLPDAAALEAELAHRLRHARDRQDVLDLARRWAHGRRFQAGLQILLGAVDALAAARTLTTIAETVLRAFVPQAENWLAEQHGRIAGGRFAVLALGKLGSRELTVGSDLDLIFVYDAHEGAVSTGKRPLDAATWYARLGTRLVTALSAQTPEGRLYEIDTRLRPSGNVGPVASSLEHFDLYQSHSAQTWEHQALTRARSIAGDAAFGRTVAMVVRKIVASERDPAPLAAAVRSMRERIFREHGSSDPWRLKHARGGLVEIEFTAQYLQLRHGHAYRELLDPDTVQVFRQAGRRGLLSPGEVTLLCAGLALMHRLSAVLRLSLEERFVPLAAPEGLRAALIRAARFADRSAPPMTFEALQGELVESQAAMRQIFARLCPPVPTPAKRGPTA